MSPHRARMTDKTLTSIVFLKCNARGGITNSALQKKTNEVVSIDYMYDAIE